MEVGSGITLNGPSACLTLATELDFGELQCATCFLEDLVCANTKGQRE